MHPPTAPASSSSLLRPPSILAAVLSYLIPGLGQIVQGRVGKGLLFMVSLLGMFQLGLAMGNYRNVYVPREDPQDPSVPQNLRGYGALTGVVMRWHFAGQFWIGIAAWPALYQFYEYPMPREDENPFVYNYQRGPKNIHDRNVINADIQRRDKSPDLGWVYTVIAGMLNVLVIYDAFAGPVFVKPTQPPGGNAPKPDEVTA